MRSRSIQCVEEAWELAPIWRQFVENSPLQSPEWLLTWWKHFGKHGKLEIILSECDQGNPIAIAPFFAWDAYGHRRLEMLGGGHVCTDYNRILSAEDSFEHSSRTVAEFVSEYFQARSSLRSSQLIVDGAAAMQTSTLTWCRLLEELGFSIWRKPIESSYRIELPESWNAFVGGLTQSARRKAKKATARINSGECSFHFTNQTDDILVRLKQLANLHQSRRQKLGQAGSYAVKNFATFLSESVRLLSAENKIRIEWCEHEGAVISMHLLLLGSETVYMYQSGIDPDFIHLEPGHCLTVSAIRNAIENRAKHYDFLRGDEPYKVFWGGVEVPLVKLSMHPPRLISKLVGETNEQLWNLKQLSGKAMNAFTSTFAYEKS